MATAMNPVTWFEIPVVDVMRAKNFYETVLGLTLTIAEMGPMRMAWFPMTENAPGATGSLVKGDGYTPSKAGTLVYFTVRDIPGVLDRAYKNGGKVVLSKTSIGEYGFIGKFEDCEGNLVAVHSFD